MKICTGLLSSMAGAAVMLGAMGFAQTVTVQGDSNGQRTNTVIRISDEGGRRHIVVERDGKVVRDEWVDAKKGSSNPFVIVDGQTIRTDPNVRIRTGQGSTFVTDRARAGTYKVDRSGNGATIHWKDADGKEHVQNVVTSGQGGVRVERSGDGRTIIWRDADGKEHTQKIVTGQGGVHVERSGDGTTVRWRDADGKEHTQNVVTKGGGNVRVNRSGKDTIIRWIGEDGKEHEQRISDTGTTLYRSTGQDLGTTIYRGNTAAGTTLRRGGAGSGTSIYRGDTAPGARSGSRYVPSDTTYVGRGGNARGMSSSDISALMRSLTTSQRDLQDRQGFLTLDDLTPYQRKMFNAPTGDDWSVSYEIGFNKLTIKSK